jgi:hypothetical protein
MQSCDRPEHALHVCEKVQTRVPFVWRSDPYAVAALAAGAMVSAGHVLGIEPVYPMLASVRLSAPDGNLSRLASSGGAPRRRRRGLSPPADSCSSSRSAEERQPS